MKLINWKCDILSGALKPEKLSKFLVTETVQTLHPHPWVFFRLLWCMQVSTCSANHKFELIFCWFFFNFILHFWTITFVFMSGNSWFKFQRVFKFQNTKLIAFDGHSWQLYLPWLYLMCCYWALDLDGQKAWFFCLFHIFLFILCILCRWGYICMHVIFSGSSRNLLCLFWKQSQTSQ